jgi:aromatic-L-amino-acid/L-tryptophan decarboxylase
MGPVPFGLVCFRYRPAGAAESGIDALNRRLLAGVNAGRRIYLTHTQLGGRFVIRVAVGQRATERGHVQEAWRLIQRTAKELSSP